MSVENRMAITHGDNLYTVAIIYTTLPLEIFGILVLYAEHTADGYH